MKNRKQEDIYCEDCAFYNRPIRPGACSAPENLKEKTYPNRVTRRMGDRYIQRYKTPEIMRLFGWLSSRLFNVCGREARWFTSASTADIDLRKPIQKRKF